MPQIMRHSMPAPVVTPPRPRSNRSWPCLLATLLTSGLLWLCYFPADFGWLAWVALVPWLMLVRAELPTRRRYFLSWLSGFVFFVPILAWMRTGFSEMVAFWLLLALYCSWYLPAALWLLRRLDRRTGLPLSVTLPLVWTGLEFARGWLMGGFAWYFLGHTQHAYLPVIQVADLAGVAAVTALVAVVNGFLAEAAGRLTVVRRWLGLPAVPRGPAIRVQTLGVAFGLAAALGYGVWRLNEGEFAAGPRVALLQPSIPQTERNAASVTDAGDPLARANIAEQMSVLTRRAVGGPDRPDLVIWPETTYPGELWEIAPGANARPEIVSWQQDGAEYVRGIAGVSKADVLLGLNRRWVTADGTVRRYNTAQLVKPTGEVVARYDKMHLVPFGEYIPLGEQLPWVRELSPYGANDYELTAGDQQTRFPLTVGDRTYHFGVLICYEDADPPLGRKLVRPGAESPVDFLVNISNDGWFMGSAEHAQHLAISRFRAVESRRALLRAVNGGISAIIDACGRMVALPAESWAKAHSVTGVVHGVVPLDTRVSLYPRLGDWLPLACWGVILIGCCRRAKPNPSL